MSKDKIKGSKMMIDFLNSKSCKAHTGSKNRFHNRKKGFTIWRLGYVKLSVSCGMEKASVVDGMKWNQPLLRGMTRLVDEQWPGSK